MDVMSTMLDAILSSTSRSCLHSVDQVGWRDRLWRDRVGCLLDLIQVNRVGCLLDLQCDPDNLGYAAQCVDHREISECHLPIGYKIKR